MNNKIITNIHLQADDVNKPSGKNRLSYEVPDMDMHSVDILKQWADEVNDRFTNLKVFVTTTVQSDEKNPGE